MLLTPPAHRVPLAFADSPRSTLGIEWELQLVDRDSLDLRQCAAEILTLVGDDPHIHGEMMLNTVELVSGARRASDIARALGIEGLRALPTDPWVVTPPTGRQA